MPCPRADPELTPMRNARFRLVPIAGLLAVMGVGVAAFAARLAAPPPAVGHMVFFTLADDTPANREKLVAACQQYLTGHEGTLYFSTGTLADDLASEVNDRDFDVALHLVFASKADHDRYQTHERHLAFIEENKALWSKVRVFDSYLAPAPAAP
jgi:hypothetical protein